MPMNPFSKQLKLVTYNIHNGVGCDRRYDLRRIARVLEAERADVIALQEVDNGLSRSGFDHQAAFLAHRLGMHYCHCITCTREQGHFGIATLSAYPILQNWQYDITHQRSREPRYCLRVDVAVAPGAVLHVFNCHLGLNTGERRHQQQRMLSEAILLSRDLHHPVVLMGDFNDRPLQVVHRRLRQHFNDSFRAVGKWFGPTFRLGPLPLRLDHIYTSREIRVIDSWVRNEGLARVASDHRPLFALVEVEWQAHRKAHPLTTAHAQGRPLPL